MKKARTQNGQSWAVKFKKSAPNQPAYDSTRGNRGSGNPKKDLVDRLGMAMSNLTK